MTNLTTISPNLAPDVVVSAPMVERLPKCQVLYWYCRMLDKAGSGQVSFSVKQAAHDLGVSRSTINRWLSMCAEHRHGVQLFRFVGRSYGGVTVYYTSFIKVAHLLGLEHGLGAIGRITLKELAYLREASTEMQIDWLQGQAYYSHKKRIEKEIARTGKVIPIVDIRRPFENSCALRPHGKTKIIGGRYYPVGASYSFTGISQGYISSQLGCSVSTVKRRVSNKERTKKDLPQVQKVQVARATDLSTENWPKMASMCPRDEGIEMRRLFNVGKTVFRAEQSIYYLNVDLTRKRQLRYKYAHLRNAA